MTLFSVGDLVTVDVGQPWGSFPAKVVHVSNPTGTAIRVRPTGRLDWSMDRCHRVRRTSTGWALGEGPTYDGSFVFHPQRLTLRKRASAKASCAPLILMVDG